MNKVWILFSADQNGWNEKNYFQQVFWEKPTIDSLEGYFNLKQDRVSTALEIDMIHILAGKKTFLFGEMYWIEEFTKPVSIKIKNYDNEQDEMVTSNLSINNDNFTVIFDDDICPI